MTRFHKLFVTICALIAMITPPGIVMYIALSHNPQNEYMDVTGQISWDLLFFLLAPSLIVGLILAAIVAMAVAILIKILNQGRKVE